MCDSIKQIKNRPGDDGRTDIGDRSRVEKDIPQIAVYGTLDELNASIGMLAACDIPEHIHTILIRILAEMIQFTGDISQKTFNITEAHLLQLDRDIQMFNQQLPLLTQFILPTGTLASAHAHFARAVCRRAEREVVALNKTVEFNPLLKKYLNRLSDLLFKIARILNQQ